MFEAVLVALADHGFTPTAIAARLTYLSRPDSLQGALAAGLLGGGSRFLGVTEDCGRVPADAVLARLGDDAARPTTPAGTPLALAAVAPSHGGRDGSCPASATRCTRTATRARPAVRASPSEEGLFGPHLRAVRGDRPGRTRRCSADGCRSTAPASAAPRWPTSACRVELLRGFALLARTAGLLGQLAEELRRPIGMDIYLPSTATPSTSPPDA